MVDNRQEPWYYSEVEVSPKPIADGPKENLNLNLKSINKFPLYLLIYFVGPRFKILRMSWYKYITPFLYNLELFIKKYLCHLHD